jgi:lipopolysaccharide biosynthesis regulator YciM
MADGKTDEAAVELERLGDRFDTVPELQLLRADVHQARGESRAAAVALRTALARLPLASWTCRECRRPAESWQSRCEGCGNWDSLEPNESAGRDAPPEAASPAA